ncbi:MAG: hypothetical protein QF442_03540 [Candidatus Peribacteraceae bacterium]|nr:hypothetical protein [Candidatus Peribacteraceae bacterium]
MPNRDYHFEQLAYQPIGPDEELATVLTQAKGDPEAALKGWLQIARPRLPAKEGVRLVPSQIQELLQLSVRQLFIGTHEVWEIGAPFSNDEFHRPCGTIIRRLL